MSHTPDAPLLDPETVARIERENTTVGQYERLAGIGQLMHALDAVNDRFGKKTLVLGTEGFKGSWGLKADHRSPRYTMRLSDLPIVAV